MRTPTATPCRRPPCAGLALAALLAAPAAGALDAFPGAEGQGAVASGGRGGAVYYVTTLDPDPGGVLPGSLNHALRQPGPRTVLFKVSGVIHGIANVVHGDVTLAGQTSPGGVIVRGLVCDGHYERNDCDNLIVRHLRLRPAWGDPLPAGGERLDDGLRLDGIDRFIIDHVSIAHATDEAVQVSWASRGTVQRSVIAETLGEHADRGGMLLNYSHPDHPQQQLSVLKNRWYRIGGRLPEITCEASGYEGEAADVSACQAAPLQLEVSNNDYFDPGFLLYYNRDVDQNAAFGPYRLQLNFVGNRFSVRGDFPYGMAVHDLLDVAENELFVRDNRIDRYPDFADTQLFYCCNDFADAAPNLDPGAAVQRDSRHPQGTVDYLPGDDLRAALLADSGAFPVDPMDRRIRAAMAGGVIDPTPHAQPLALDALALDFDPDAPPAAPADSDGDGLPDDFEREFAAYGLDPDRDDHNGDGLSLALTGVVGYSNLEVYLNRLADALVAPSTRIHRDGFESAPGG